MNRTTQFSRLSAGRQALVRLFESTVFGYIEGLEIRGGEPVFNPAPIVFQEVKLDVVSEPPARLSDLPDFELRTELIRLMDELDRLRDGVIERIDIRYGVPRRALVERPIEGVRR